MHQLAEPEVPLARGLANAISSNGLTTAALGSVWTNVERSTMLCNRCIAFGESLTAFNRSSMSTRPI